MGWNAASFSHLQGRRVLEQQAEEQNVRKYHEQAVGFQYGKKISMRESEVHKVKT